ncbi:unnamed protein product [Vicia faba]|uniref:Uncharacterized protein n=1 Tax=Vicia faba TaxID=3906 RepID=A0AAV1ABW8_VICFA|nr:unnamed protein product [Vicia faba]
MPLGEGTSGSESPASQSDSPCLLGNGFGRISTTIRLVPWERHRCGGRGGKNGTTFGLDLVVRRKPGSARSSPNLTSISIYEYRNDLPKPGVRWKKTWERGLASLPLLMVEYLSKPLAYLYYLSSHSTIGKRQSFSFGPVVMIAAFAFAFSP